jgi:hypothetical protein
VLQGNPKDDIENRKRQNEDRQSGSRKGWLSHAAWDDDVCISTSQSKREQNHNLTRASSISLKVTYLLFIYQDKLHHNHHDGGPRLMFSSGSRSINMHSNWGMINAMRSKAPVIRCSANSCLLDYFPEAYFHLWTLLLHCYSIDWAELLSVR